MSVIIAWLESLVQCIFMLIQYLFWMLGGILNTGTLMMESVNITSEILQFLPSAVLTALMGVFTMLIALRILGRS